MATSAGEETNEETDLATASADEGSEPSSASASVNKKGMTPGQRLAAKKAAKAARKKELKEEEAAAAAAAAPEEPEIPEEVEQVAQDFSTWMEENRNLILGGIAAFLVVGAGALLFNRTQDEQASVAAAALQTAVETSTAAIDKDSPKEADDDGPAVFASVEDRTKKALEAFQSLQSAHGGSVAAQWGTLGEATTALASGDAETARGLFEKVLAAGGSDFGLQLRATEGVGLSLEAEKKYDEASAQFKKLGELADGVEKDLSDYHVARMLLAKGDTEGAKNLLKEAYDRLSDPKEGAAPNRYVRGQVEMRLMEIDSSLVDRVMPTAPGAGDMSQEQIQELIRQLQQKQQQQGVGQ